MSASTPVTPPLPEAAHKLIAKIATSLEKLDDSEVGVRRDVGKIIVELTTDPDGKYGRPTMSDLEKFLPYKKDTLLPCQRLAERFSDEEFTEMRALKGPTGRTLGWGHYREIIQFKGDFKKLRDIAAKALEKSKTWKELKTERKKQNPNGPTSQGGRKHKIPETLEDLVDQSVAFATTVANKIDAWTSDDRPAYEQEFEEMTNAQRKAAARALRAAAVSVDQGADKLYLQSKHLDRLAATAEKLVEDAASAPSRVKARAG